MDILKLKEIIKDGHISGKKAYDEYLIANDHCGICGDSYCFIIKYNDKKIVNYRGVGKLLKEIGLLQNIHDEFYFIDKGDIACIDAKHEYQKAFSEYLNNNGFTSYADISLLVRS